MTIVHCPRCRDEVTVPAKASPKALVRCPLCLEEYLLAEALAEMPPTLLVVGGEMEEEPALVSAGVAAEAGGEYNLSGNGYGAGVFDSSAPAGATVSPARPGVKTGARPRRKERSAIGEMVKIVLGGVVGLFLGLMVLWWIAQKDPLKLGPQVSPYAPWIVPAEFRHKPIEAGTTAQNNPASNPTTGNKGSSPLTPPAGGGGLQTLPDPATTEPGTINPIAPASIDVPSLDTLPTTESAPTTPEENPGAAPSAETPSPEKPPVDLTNLLPEGTSPPATTETPNPPAPEGSAGVAAADLATAVQSANDALAAVEAGKGESKEVRQQLFTDLYLAVANAGRVISHLDPADADVADPLAQLKRFLSEIAAQPGKVSAFSHLGRTHLPQRKDGEGFVIAGRVVEYRVAGSAFETTLDAGNNVQVLFVSPGNPQDFCEVGDQLLVVGRIVDKPAQHIGGYEGEAQRVMLLGHAAQISKAE